MLDPRLDGDEVEYLKDFLSKKPEDSKMVEWGSGGSTLMFLPFFEKGQFISIEHNDEWFDKVSTAITQQMWDDGVMANFTYCHIPPYYRGSVVNKAFYGYGVPYEENPCFASRYINPELGGTKIWDADIYFVDGICRGAILATIRALAEKRARVYIEPDGVWQEQATVFIHDYYGPEQREPWYDWASTLYSKVEKVGNTLARLYL